MTTTRTAAVLALLAAAAAGCKKESAIEKVKTQTSGAVATGSADPVTLSVSVAKPEVALGDDIVFHFKITNTSGAKTTVNVPRLDRRCTELRFRRPNGGVGTVTRIRADIPDGAQTWVFEAPQVRELGPGESLEEDVPVVAVEAGKAAVTATYVRLGATPALAAPTIDVNVTPADAKAPRLGVKLETTHGDYTAVLRPDVAYNTVENFASLVKRNYYSGVKFHRIVAGFMAQGGDPTGTGGGGPGWFIPHEGNVALRHARGVLSMARTGAPRIGQDTAGSQFFIMFASNPGLDRDRCQDGFGYTTFGQMVDGEATVQALEKVPVTPNPMSGERSTPTVTVQIKRASLVHLP